MGTYERKETTGQIRKQTGEDMFRKIAIVLIIIIAFALAIINIKNDEKRNPQLPD